MRGFLLCSWLVPPQTIFHDVLYVQDDVTVAKTTRYHEPLVVGDRVPVTLPF